jgi:VCBS repeat-containing protein
VLTIPRNAHTSGATTGVLANDNDPDIHDTLQVSAVNGVGNEVGHSVAGKYGSLTLDADGSYTYVENFIGKLLSDLNISEDDTFRYTISDGHGGTASSTLTFDTRESLPPVAKADAATDVVGQSVSTDAAHGVLANDTDPSGDTLSVSSVSSGNHLVQIASGNAAVIAGEYGTLTLGADGSYSYLETVTNIPKHGAQDVFDYTVSDGHGGTAQSTLDVAITASTDANNVLNVAKSYLGDVWGNENCTGFIFTVSDQEGSPFFDHRTTGNQTQNPLKNLGAYGSDSAHLLNDTSDSNSFSFQEPISDITLNLQRTSTWWSTAS